ncbi:hypothetical protein AAMO2058_000790100 [Amorphochlora amoebiformis]
MQNNAHTKPLGLQLSQLLETPALTPTSPTSEWEKRTFSFLENLFKEEEAILQAEYEKLLGEIIGIAGNEAKKSRNLLLKDCEQALKQVKRYASHRPDTKLQFLQYRQSQMHLEVKAISMFMNPEHPGTLKIQEASSAAFQKFKNSMESEYRQSIENIDHVCKQQVQRGTNQSQAIFETQLFNDLVQESIKVFRRSRAIVQEEITRMFKMHKNLIVAFQKATTEGNELKAKVHGHLL